MRLNDGLLLAAVRVCVYLRLQENVCVLLYILRSDFTGTKPLLHAAMGGCSFLFAATALLLLCVCVTVEP
jgi:hypothetical protein